MFISSWIFIQEDILMSWLENLPLSLHLFFSQFKLRLFNSFFRRASRSLGMTSHGSFKRTSPNSLDFVLFTFDSQRLVRRICTPSEKLYKLASKWFDLIFQRRVILPFAFTFPFVLRILWFFWVRIWIILRGLLFTCELWIQIWNFISRNYLKTCICWSGWTEYIPYILKNWGLWFVSLK